MFKKGAVYLVSLISLQTKIRILNEFLRIYTNFYDFTKFFKTFTNFYKVLYFQDIQLRISTNFFKGGVHSFVYELVRLKILPDRDIPMGLLFLLIKGLKYIHMCTFGIFICIFIFRPFTKK